MQGWREVRRCGFALLVSALLLGCTSKASPQQLSALQDQNAASASAENRVQMLEKDRDALRIELAEEQAKARILQAEMDSLQKRISK